MKALLVHFRSCFRISLTLSVAVAAPPPRTSARKCFPLLFALSAQTYGAEVLHRMTIPGCACLPANVPTGQTDNFRGDYCPFCHSRTIYWLKIAFLPPDGANGQLSGLLLSVSHITDNIRADNCAFAGRGKPIYTEHRVLHVSRTPLISFAPAPSTVSFVPLTRNLSPADPSPCPCPGS